MRKNTFFVFIFFFVLFSIVLNIFIQCTVSATDNPKNYFARFNTVSGHIKIAENDNEVYKTLSPEDALKAELKNGFFITTENATCEIEFKNKARVEIDKNTKLQLNIDGIRINNGGGWIKYYARKKKDGGYVFKIETPTAFIGIRGTVFAVAYIQEISYIQVTEGAVDVIIKSNSKKYVLNPGEMLEYDPGKINCEPHKFEVGFDLIDNLNKAEHKKINNDNDKKSQTIDNPWKSFKKNNNE